MTTRKLSSLKRRFLDAKRETPTAFSARMNLSWSQWAFGAEDLERSLVRLKQHAVDYIELAGIACDADPEVASILPKALTEEFGIAVSGICGMFTTERDLSSADPEVAGKGQEYVRRNAAFGALLRAHYFLLLPGANGNSRSASKSAPETSAENLRQVAGCLYEAKVKGAVEPVNAAEVPFCHTLAEAEDYIRMVCHPGVQHINADVYHMWAAQEDIGKSLIAHAHRLVNVHVADTNRGVLGTGELDIDDLIMALYLSRYNQPGRFVTFEPILSNADPYTYTAEKQDAKRLDALVHDSVTAFRDREEALLSL